MPDKMPFGLGENAGIAIGPCAECEAYSAINHLLVELDGHAIETVGLAYRCGHSVSIRELPHVTDRWSTGEPQ